MLLHPAHANHVDPPIAALRLAPAPTRDLIRTLIAGICTRLPNLGTRERERIDRLIAASAWTDAALAVIECELPQWKPRRLAYDDGEWHCALSRQLHLPDDLDDTADGRHAVMALAILDAFVEARRRSTAGEVRRAAAVPRARRVGRRGLLRQLLLKDVRIATMNVHRKIKMLFASTSNRPPHRVHCARAQSLIADVAIAVLAFFVLLCVGLITPALWTAIVESGDSKLSLCDTSKNPLERLACEDTLNDGPPHPARGATAPLGAGDGARPGRATGP